ncbi:sensor histidine kinase [Paenibacillus camerounensis]|uniref:sensor histidine kinase n=1 Tax=Paenibacillus camerounensis TaxID=1243663 RepID=UPI00069456FF|nr:HAMP domain-containing sensor histidine kinase [Paenibacillus camerounensis]
MRRFDRLILWTISIGIAVICLFAAYGFKLTGDSGDKAYRIEVNRIIREVSDGREPGELKVEKFSYVRNTAWLEWNAEPEAVRSFFDGAGVQSNAEYTVKPIYHGGEPAGYLRLEYVSGTSRSPLLLLTVILLGAVLAAISGLLLYIRQQIIRPFHTIEELPYALSKGNLTQDMKESKSRFFGKFIWGLNLLRETLERQKQTNLRLEKDRQTLIASLSHELKTPVAAIKLYSSALAEGLYDNEDKRIATAGLIGQKAAQIEEMISSIIAASVSSLQETEVHVAEFYLKDWIRRVVEHYKERLELLKIRFEVAEPEDKLLLGDPDKLLEVMDNLLENAIKYGDGSLIRISFREEDYRQLIIIENTGNPVPATELPHIFTSFWRGSNSAGRQGNGLGLFICRQLMRKMDGDIYGEAYAEGMRFVLVLRY